MINSAIQLYDPFMAKATNSYCRLTKILESFQNFTANSDILSSDTTIIYLILQSNIIFNEIQIRVILGLGNRNKVHDAIYWSIQRDVKYAARKLFSIGNISTLLEIPLTDLKQLCYEIALKYKPIFFVPVESKIIVRSAQSDFTSLLDPRQFGLQRITSEFIPSSYLISDLRNQNNRIIGRSLTTDYSPEPTTHSYNSTQNHQPDHTQREDTEYVEIIKFISKFNQMWIIAAIINKEYQELQISGNKGTKK